MNRNLLAMVRSVCMAAGACMMAGIGNVATAQTVVFQNGFEAPVVGALGLTGAFTFGPWSGVGPSHGGNAGVVRGTDNGLAPAEGVQHFAFNGGNPSDRGWIEVSIATVPGVDYVLSYALGRGGQVGQLLNVKAEVIEFGTSAVLNADLQAPPQANNYVTATLGWTGGASGFTRIRFTDVSGPNQVSDLWLDDVSVRTLYAIPEPADVAMIAGIVCAVFVIMRRRAMKRNESTILLNPRE